MHRKPPRAFRRGPAGPIFIGVRLKLFRKTVRAVYIDTTKAYFIFFKVIRTWGANVAAFERISIGVLNRCCSDNRYGENGNPARPQNAMNLFDCDMIFNYMLENM